MVGKKAASSWNLLNIGGSFAAEFLNEDHSIPGAGLDGTIKGKRYASKDVK
jgi:hypothetical protein